MRRIAILILLLILTSLDWQEKREIISVALFAWIPDMSYAFDQIENNFEKKHPEYNLEIEALDPYSNEENGIYKGINNFYDFDVVELDYYRFHEFGQGHSPSLDPIPEGVNRFTDLAGPATQLSPDELQYILPHWICGKYLVFRSSNKELMNARSFEDVLSALDPDTCPLYMDFYGDFTLGEYYTDAVLDTYGEAVAREHLTDLSLNENARLKPEIVDKMMLLFEKVHPKYREQIDKYHEFSYLFAEEFYLDTSSAFFGYSEGLYYTELSKKESELIAHDEVTLSDEEFSVIPFPFAEYSKSTPSWVDGFIIPAGKSNGGKEAIVTFLNYMISDEAYEVINKSAPSVPGRYLLPAYKRSFTHLSGKLPLLLEFVENQQEYFLIDNTALFEGMKNASKEISRMVLSAD